MDLFIAFITGLTTGGLSCLAVQGGLLTSSLANQIEQDLQSRRNRKNGVKPRFATPILLFLFSKLLAYTLLGLLLGGLGSLFQLTPMMRAMLLIAIGIFMLGNGLRMLKISPIFRFFVFEPPSTLTRYIRRSSKNGNALFTPLFLGALTVLIPCGVAQAMMATALSSGSALRGAALMFAFTLGTSPVFFSVAYFATRLGSRLEKYFTRIVAITVLILGLISIDSGLNLAGSPISISGFMNSSSAPLVTASSSSSPSLSNPYTVNVTNNGYQPQVLHLAANRSVRLNWNSVNVSSCALSVVVPGLGYEKVLPATGNVTMEIPAQKKGTLIRYSCSMGMYLGQLVFDLD
jgi:sulfite exporter TauE/SafE